MKLCLREYKEIFNTDVVFVKIMVDQKKLENVEFFK